MSDESKSEWKPQKVTLIAPVPRMLVPCAAEPLELLEGDAGNMEDAAPLVKRWQKAWSFCNTSWSSGSSTPDRSSTFKRKRRQGSNIEGVRTGAKTREEVIYTCFSKRLSSGGASFS